MDRARTRRAPDLASTRWFEECEPPAHDSLEVVALEPVDAVAALATYRDDPGGFEDVQMAGGCRPAVTEPAGQVPGRQLGAVVSEEQHDVASRLMSESFEDRLDLDERRPSPVRGSPSCHDA